MTCLFTAYFNNLHSGVMQDVDAGMKAIDDHMPAAYDRMHSACILHGSLMWPRLKCKLSSEAKPFLLPYSKYTQDFTPRH